MVIMAFTTMVKAQITINFCAYVIQQNRECVFDNTKFVAAKDSPTARIFIMANSKDAFGSDVLVYKIYSLDDKGKETFVKAIPQSVQTDWQSAWQPATLKSPAKYIVKVYKDLAAETLVTSKSFEFVAY